MQNKCKICGAGSYSANQIRELVGTAQVSYILKTNNSLVAHIALSEPMSEQACYIETCVLTGKATRVPLKACKEGPAWAIAQKYLIQYLKESLGVDYTQTGRFLAE